MLTKYHIRVYNEIRPTCKYCDKNDVCKHLQTRFDISEQLNDFEKSINTLLDETPFILEVTCKCYQGAFEAYDPKQDYA